MGAVFCCFRGADDRDEQHQQPAAPTNGCCFCIRWTFQPFINAYAAVRQRADTRVAPDQERASGVSNAPQRDDSSIDTFHPPPRPLPYDDPRFSHHHSVITGNEKASTHFDKVVELGKNKKIDTESTNMEEEEEEKSNGSSLKNQEGDATNGGTEIFVSSEDEDDCPICLEEYTRENPRIILQCNHHFHLSCIYEWMERSEACPVCAKVMLFNEDA